MKFYIKTITIISLISMFLIPFSIGEEINILNYNDDLDPLVDISVTVEIQTIRSFDKEEKQFNIIPYISYDGKDEYIDFNSDPDFYVKILINGEEFTSDIWFDTKYIYSPVFSATLNVPDNQEYVDITIQLWDWNNNGDVLCDIGNENYDVDITYNIKTGHWSGDDQLNDLSGYGRLNGCDDGSIYTHDFDCEMWFDIFQNDYDNDGIPYWIETNIYGTSPLIENIEDDDDNDAIPIEWEYKWGYNPFDNDNHYTLDDDDDSLTNYEEYLTSEYGSDPFRKDIFTELDQMEQGPNGETCLLPEESKELLYTAFNRQNLVYHLDDGRWEDSGSDLIPFDRESNYNELNEVYQEYFLNNKNDNWKRGVFHYGLVIYDTGGVPGYNFGSNRYQISAKGIDDKLRNILDKEEAYASCYMHELGHNLAFWPIPGHNIGNYGPWQIGWWLTRNYKSCMNYGYMYYTVDYSDGSRGYPDYDDWSRMDLSYFERS